MELGGHYSLPTMCIGVWQGIAVALEHVNTKNPRAIKNHAGVSGRID